jgi:hypothetical protein
MTDYIQTSLGNPELRQVDAWYDNKEELEKRIREKGLDGLREIAKARHEAGYDRKERMAEWCLMGIFWTDTCGNFSVMTKGAPTDSWGSVSREVCERFHYEMPLVMDKETTLLFTQSWTSTHGLAVPPEGALCDCCGEGWSMRNIRDFYTRYNHNTETHVCRHKGCQRLYIIQREQEEITGYLTRAGVRYSKITWIPSQYHPDDMFFGPWALVKTEKGTLKMGWRKRVFVVDWSKMDLESTGSDLVAEPDVTHGDQYVHCWGKENIIKTLKGLHIGGGDDLLAAMAED